MLVIIISFDYKTFLFNETKIILYFMYVFIYLLLIKSYQFYLSYIIV